MLSLAFSLHVFHKFGIFKEFFNINGELDFTTLNAMKREVKEQENIEDLSKITAAGSRNRLK